MMKKQSTTLLFIIIMFIVFLSRIFVEVASTDALSFPIAGSATPSLIMRPPLFISNAPLAGADLIVESIEFYPENPSIGESVDITVTIKNQGDTTVSGFYTYLYINPQDQPPNTNTLHTSRTYWGIPLGAGASFTWTRTDETFNANGNYPVYAWVDRDDDANESDNSNNMTGPVTITVGTVTDSYEPDNSCAQANQIPVNGEGQNHNLIPVPDKDWVKFDVIGGVTYHVQGIAAGVDADLVAELHGTCSGPPSFGSGADFVFTAPADGTYYLKIEHVEIDYGLDTDYRLKITTLDNCNTLYEPNDDCAIAQDIYSNTAAQGHDFCKANDFDWTKLQVQAGADYVIQTTNIGVNADAQISLHASCSDSSTFGGGQRIEFTANSDNIYYIKTENMDPQVYGENTEYALQVTGGGGCTIDMYEGDGTASEAKPLTVDGVVQGHNVCPSGDVDWAKFTAVAGTMYTIETLNLGASSDTVMCLFDESGTVQIGCDDDSGEGEASRLIWQAPDDENYTIRVQDYDNTVPGDETQYDLHVMSQPCALDDYETDNEQSAAKSINVNGAGQSHNICLARDVDWVKFMATSGSHLIGTESNGDSIDTIIELYDTDGNRLAVNDDYGPGTDSLIHYNFTTSGTYYVKVRHFNPNQYGTGNEYTLTVKTGTPTTPTPTATPPTSTPTPTPPPPSSVKTIILVHQDRFEEIYGAPATSPMMAKLTELAGHTNVQGEIIRLDLNSAIDAAYNDWTADLTNTEKANQVTSAIRGVVMTYLQQHDGVEYIVLVGDDRTLPFRRIQDNTPRNNYLERDYPRVNRNHPTGAALKDNYFLSDDYYADIDPIPFNGRELYIPDLAIGRLIETPDEIIAFINRFQGESSVTVDSVLITGYDFVQDTANNVCQAWQSDGISSVGCSLIGDSWSLADYRDAQLNANPPFKIQSINGHANHYREGAPGFGQSISGADIAASSSDLSGGLIYTLGCHSGLNVPPANSEGILDLAQAFAQKQSNYVANTGYGWGLRGAVGLSERLIELYTEELRRDLHSSMGQSLVSAKTRYYQENQDLNGYDEKILEELVFYGLPMYQINTGASFEPGSFSSVEIIVSLPGTFGDDTVISTTVDIDLIGSFGPGDIMSQTLQGDGAYYSLDEHNYVNVGQPVQPFFYADVMAGTLPARSVLFLGAEYEIISGFDPFVASPVNDYMTQTAEIPLADNRFYPAAPANVQNQSGISNLVVQFGQYNAALEELYLFNGFDLNLYYSFSSDKTPPEIGVIDGLYNPDVNQTLIKVGAVDEYGVGRVVVSYTELDGHWQSVEAIFDDQAHKWIAHITTNDAAPLYFVQIVDLAGNVTQATNKGKLYAPSIGNFGHTSHKIYLPIVVN